MSDSKLDYQTDRAIVRIAAIYFPDIKNVGVFPLLQDPGIGFGSPRVPIMRDNGDGITAKVEYEEIPLIRCTYEVRDRTFPDGRRHELMRIGYGPLSHTLLVADLDLVRAKIKRSLQGVG